MTAREKLKAAVAKAANLEDQKAKLEKALTTATDAEQAATDELQRFSDLDAAIKRYRIEATKNRGNARELPQVLKDRLAARRNAVEEIEQAVSTREAIAEELDDIEKRLAPMKETKTACAVDVLREEADRLAAELIVINERRRDLIQILEGFADVNFMQNGRMGTVGYTSAMSKALGGFNYAFSLNLSPLNDMGNRWLARINALLANPDVEVTIPQNIKPSDYTDRTPVWNGPGHLHPQSTVILRAEA
jgi:hypothetical protein